MDAKNIFNLLNSTLWQDFKGFLRDEINKDKGTVEMPFIITAVPFRNHRG